MQIWCSHPSGHSTNTLIIGKFENTEIAAKVAESLESAVEEEKIKGDWEDWNVRCNGDEVSFSAYTEDTDLIESYLDRKDAKDISCIYDPQDVTIEFEFDTPEASAEEIKTLLLVQHPGLASILSNAHTLTEDVEHREGKTVFRINYFGENIYDEESEILFAGRDLKVGEDINCKVYT